jgi:hypothetical protein
MFIQAAYSLIRRRLPALVYQEVVLTTGPPIGRLKRPASYYRRAHGLAGTLVTDAGDELQSLFKRLIGLDHANDRQR